MFKGLYVDKPLSVTIKEEQEQELQADQIRIRTRFAAIKHGTDLHLFSGQSPFQNRRFDQDLRLFVPKEEPENADAYVHYFIGNMVVGTVEERGHAITKFKPGERVYAYGPICELVTKTEDSVYPLPTQMNELDAVCTDPALYALAAVRDARISLGDNAVVFGLGAIGLFVLQMLKLNGCLHVIAVDPIEKRRVVAQKLGADLVLDPTQCDVGQEIRAYLGQGADVAIEASGHYKALSESMRAVRQCARVVTLGFYKGRASDLELGAEWHHNRLELIGSMPVWNNPLRDHPGWNLQRLTQSVVELFSRKLLTSTDIVDPIVDFTSAPEAFLNVFHQPANSIKLGVRFYS